MSPKNNNAFSNLIEIQRRTLEAFRPYIDLQNQLETQAKTISASLAAQQAMARNLAKSVSGIEKLIKSLNAGNFTTAIDNLVKNERSSRALEKAGWLPHYTTPFEKIDEADGDEEKLRDLLSNYYRENWLDVRKQLESHLDNYSVDDEAKDTFREALDAHQGGFYRCTCRVLLPEIERAARVELHQDTLDSITSQKDLRTLAGELPPVLTEPRGYYSVALYRYLDRHIYKHVNDENRAEFANDAVPNRHAAVHGYLSYRTAQNSLNTIFLTEYVFQVISVVKNYSSD